MQIGIIKQLDIQQLPFFTPLADYRPPFMVERIKEVTTHFKVFLIENDLEMISGPMLSVDLG